MQEDFLMNKIEEALQILHSQHEVFDKQTKLLERTVELLEAMDARQQSIPPATAKRLAGLISN